MPEATTRKFVLGFGIVGFACLAGALLCASSELRFRAKAVTVSGTIVELARRPARTGAVFRPVFEFSDLSGRRHRVAGTVASSPPAYQLGEQVTVRFLPENPRDAQIVGFAESWFGTVVLGVLGSVFAALAAGVRAASAARDGAGVG